MAQQPNDLSAVPPPLSPPPAHPYHTLPSHPTSAPYHQVPRTFTYLLAPSRTLRRSPIRLLPSRTLPHPLAPPTTSLTLPHPASSRACSLSHSRWLEPSPLLWSVRRRPSRCAATSIHTPPSHSTPSLARRCSSLAEAVYRSTENVIVHRSPNGERLSPQPGGGMLRDCTAR